MTKIRLALFQHHPQASRQCCEGMIRALNVRFDVRLFDVTNCTGKTLGKADIVVFPGGVGESDAYKKILGRHQDVIQRYLWRGGRYLGVCMGAYWAGQQYFDLLDGIKVEQYIKRPTAEIRRSFGTVALVEWMGEHDNMFFYDGPVFVPSPYNAALTGTRIIARYANDEPMAVIQKKIGLIGCHPESMPSWYRKRYLEQHWHDYEHHELLADFVDELANQ